MKPATLSFIIIFCPLFLFQSLGQQVATGTVYLDSDNNGSMGTKEKGISDVPVSNGQDVVLTDEDGQYSIKIDDQDGKVFVIKPAGYRLPTDEWNRPQYYYLHKPDGSPDLKYEGVKPTGPLPDSINFALRKGEQKKEFEALIFGDPQPDEREELDFFDRDIVSELHNAEGYDFGITLGDMVDERLDWFKPYSKIVSKVGIPWFHVYGNNDMNMQAESNQYADETFEATFGPANYSFNHGKAHFIVLDNIIFPRKDGGRGYKGGFTERQLEFVKNDLKHVSKDKLVILVIHMPLFDFPEEDRARLFNLLEKYPHTLSISAHTHEQQFRFFDEEQNWGRLKPHIHYNAGTTSGLWWTGELDERGIPSATMRDGTPNGYAMLNIDGNSFTIDYKVANKPADYRMSIWGPELVLKGEHFANFYVNYFLGNKFTDVSYRVKGTDSESWRPMQREKRRDPHLTAVRTKWDRSEKLLEGDRPVNPVESTHIWTGFVPNNLPLGEQTLEIRVTDIFGRTFTDEFTYEVVGSK